MINLNLVWVQFDEDSPELSKAIFKSKYSGKDIQVFKQVDFETPTCRIFKFLNADITVLFKDNQVDIYNGYDLPKHLENLIVFYHFLDHFNTNESCSDFDRIVSENSILTLEDLQLNHLNKLKSESDEPSASKMKSFIDGQDSILVIKDLQ